MRALRPLRQQGRLEVFRDAAMLQRRGHFTAGCATKRAAEGAEESVKRRRRVEHETVGCVQNTEPVKGDSVVKR